MYTFNLKLQTVLKDQISSPKPVGSSQSERKVLDATYRRSQLHRIEFKGTLEQPKQEDIGKINQSNGSNIATDPRSENLMRTD